MPCILLFLFYFLKYINCPLHLRVLIKIMCSLAGSKPAFSFCRRNRCLIQCALDNSATASIHNKVQLPLLKRQKAHWGYTVAFSYIGDAGSNHIKRNTLLKIFKKVKLIAVKYFKKKTQKKTDIYTKHVSSKNMYHTQ